MFEGGGFEPERAERYSVPFRSEHGEAERRTAGVKRLQNPSASTKKPSNINVAGFSYFQTLTTVVRF
jgi:hypothetical protein